MPAIGTASLLEIAALGFFVTCFCFATINFWNQTSDINWLDELNINGARRKAVWTRAREELFSMSKCALFVVVAVAAMTIPPQPRSYAGAQIVAEVAILGVGVLIGIGSILRWIERRQLVELLEESDYRHSHFRKW